MAHAESPSFRSRLVLAGALAAVAATPFILERTNHGAAVTYRSASQSHIITLGDHVAALQSLSPQDQQTLSTLKPESVSDAAPFPFLLTNFPGGTTLGESGPQFTFSGRREASQALQPPKAHGF